MAHILVVEDDNEVREMLRMMLERAGYTVSEASDGNLAIKIYKNEIIDLIITDIIMPEKEGLETILDLKRYDSKVKIIAISGGGRMEATDFLDSAKIFGANRIFKKPFDRKEILNSIKELLAEN